MHQIQGSLFCQFIRNMWVITNLMSYKVRRWWHGLSNVFEMINQMSHLAVRLGIPVSWLLQKCARKEAFDCDLASSEARPRTAHLGLMMCLRQNLPGPNEKVRPPNRSTPKHGVHRGMCVWPARVCNRPPACPFANDCHYWHHIPDLPALLSSYRVLSMTTALPDRHDCYPNPRSLRLSSWD